MNKFTECSIDKSRARKVFSLFMLFLCLLPVLLETVLVTPLYYVLEKDVAYSGGFLVMLLYYLKDIISILAFSSAYAIIIFSNFFVDKKTSRTVVWIYSTIFLAQIPLKIAMNIFVDGSLGSLTEILIDLAVLALYFILYMIQLLLVYFFATTDTGKYLRYVEFVKSKSKKKGKKSVTEDVQLGYVIPFSKFIDKFNPLQRSAMKMSFFIVFGIRVFFHIVGYVGSGALLSWQEALIMCGDFLADILYAIAAYLVALLIFTLLYDRLKQKKTDEAEASPEDDKISVLED